MKFAIIAAGQGSRLVAEGIGVSKPLLRVNGEMMIERLLRIFLVNGAESISVITNEEMTDVHQFLEQVKLPVPFHLVTKTTPDSLHSFYELSPFLQGGKFCLTTVDTIFTEEEFSSYIHAFREDEENDALMPVTDYMDDEKPLYVKTDSNLRITGFYDEVVPDVHYVSGGIYGLNEKALSLFQRAMLEGLSRMRNFQRLMITSGLQVKAYPFSKIIDVDHESDMRKAEDFIKKEFTEVKTGIQIAGIPRNTLFSPNHIGNDAAIFSAVSNLLCEAGFQINTYTEQEFLVKPLQERFIFTMLRSEQAIRRLQQFEEGGGRSVNSVRGIENCTRERMTKLLMQHRIPHPDSLIVGVEEAVSTFPSGKRITSCWIKRGDFHAIHREDVTYVTKAEHLKEVMAEYALRNIQRVVINEHLEGDLVKFYGVAGTDFFHWFYPYNQGHSKFGHETVNGKPEEFPFSVEYLKEICDAAANALGLVVYGGDCIISADGNARIIDFNDWPSFAPCREEASCAIASIIIKTIQEQN